MTTFVDYPCPTCHALPGTRCVGLEHFGGAMMHGMLPGTHEWPRTPTCRCGAKWDMWSESCARRPATYCPKCDKRIMRRSISRHIKRMHQETP